MNIISTIQDRLTFKSDRQFNIFILVIFIALGCVGILNHEMWRDELQAWMIVKDTSSIVDIFKNLKYESHPGLWYICLYLISRFTRSPVAMQFLHLAIATTSVYVVVRFSPFSRIQKFLLSFGYFLFYEYSLISRSYALGVLLIFLFCTLFKNRKRNYVSISIVLVLLANTSIYGLILAFSLALTLGVDALNEEKLNSFKISNRKFYVILLILVIGYSLAVLQMLPPKDSGFLASTEIPSLDFYKIQATLEVVWKSYVPIPKLSSTQFWDSNIVENGILWIGLTKLSVLSLLLIFLAGVLLANNLTIFALYTSGTLGILLFTYYKYFGSIRHHGHLFLLLVACWWLSYYYPRLQSQLSKRYASKFLTVILCCHLVGGAFAYSKDLAEPFSAGKEAVRFLNSQPHLSNLPLAGSTDYVASSIAGLMDKKIFYFEGGRVGSFIIWDQKRRQGMATSSRTESQVLEKLQGFMQQERSDIVLILSYPLERDSSDSKIHELARFTRSITIDEHYYLYHVQRQN
jgi:hypothetical protein